MRVTTQSQDDGIVQIGQSGLIALARDAGLLRQPKGVIRSPLHGGFLSPFKGRGMEFDEARPYQPGDDVRNMDWRVTARTNKPHSKVFREERERPILLWVDFRSAMFFGTQNCFKSVLAARAAALLAWKTSQAGDRLGGLLFSDERHLELRPGRGKAATLRLIKHLSEFSALQPDANNDQLERRDSSHALNRLLHVTRPGSLIYLISDFRHLDHRFESTLSRLSRHNELELIHISDPLESHLPGAGYFRVTDGKREIEINAFNQQTRQQYQQRFLQHQQYLQDFCKKTRTRYIALSTAEDLLEGLQEQGGRR